MVGVRAGDETVLLPGSGRSTSTLVCLPACFRGGCGRTGGKSEKLDEGILHVVSSHPFLVVKVI